MQKSIAEMAKRWLTRQPGGLSDAENRVLRSTIDRLPVARDTSETSINQMTFGDRLADAIARIGGSWTFIIPFIVFLVVWTAGNAWLLGRETFDPYPFIFLNLVLSMIAALQAPFIMMSQNRQTERDRIDASHDYEVNLKAEIEIMGLHEKFDEIRHREIAELKDEMARIRAMIEQIDSRLAHSGAAR